MLQFAIADADHGLSGADLDAFGGPAARGRPPACQAQAHHHQCTGRIGLPDQGSSSGPALPLLKLKPWPLLMERCWIVMRP